MVGAFLEYNAILLNILLFTLCLIQYSINGNISTGSCFIRTDQLDGETDWKLRIALPACQSLHSDHVSK